MQDIKGNTVHVGDKVRFFGSGDGMCPETLNDPDFSKRFRAYGVVVSIDENTGIAGISVRGASRTWSRYGRSLLVR